MFSLVSAESIGTYKFGSRIQLTQVCDNCTQVNLTKVVYPNGTFALLGLFPMTKNNTNYNYSYTQTNVSGNYLYTTCGDLNGILTCEDMSFSINNVGSELTTGKTIIYFFLFIVIAFFIIILPFGINMLPSENTRDNEGYVVQVSWLKYLRPLLWGLEYMMILSLFFLSGNIAEAYLGEQLFADFFLALFMIGTIMILPFALVRIIYLFQEMVMDFDITKKLNRGVKYG